MLSLAPFGEERPLDGAPIAIQPRLDQRVRADQVKPADISGVAREESLVVRDPRRNYRNGMNVAVRQHAFVELRSGRERPQLVALP